ncbi:hypothetical protein ARMGADRAFT_939141, partial [Armillaria gallica]
VPVPKVWMQFWEGNTHYVVMNCVPGQCLTEIWSHLPHEVKRIIVGHRGQYIRRIRLIPLPLGPRICSVLGEPLHNYRMHDDGDRGSFRDEAHLIIASSLIRS